MANRVKKIRIVLLDLLYDVIGSISYAVGLYTFAKMAGFAPGGLSGLALIANHLWGLPIGVTTLVLNIPIILVSCRILGKVFLLKSLKSMVISTIFLDVVFPYTPAYTGSPLMAALYSGVFLGAGLALFYMRGSSTGGTDFLTMSIRARYPYLSLGAVTMGIDLLVISLGGVVFGNVDAALYGLVATFVTSTVIDKIMYGLDAGKLLIIITNHGQLVADRIGEVTGRGSTAIRARGTYTKQNRDVILCACSRSQSYTVKNAVHEIDSTAFVMLVETSQVFGEGFIEGE